MNFLENLQPKRLISMSTSTFFDNFMKGENSLQLERFTFLETIDLNLKLDNSFQRIGCSFKESPKFTDEHLLRPSSFPNGSVCGHLREIRSINFAPKNNNINYRKINIKPVNLKIKTH